MSELKRMYVLRDSSGCEWNDRTERWAAPGSADALFEARREALLQKCRIGGTL